MSTEIAIGIQPVPNSANTRAARLVRDSGLTPPLAHLAESGFTLIELIIVMAIIAILAALAIPRFTSSIKAAQEAVLKEDLHVLRNAIDSYTMDKQKAPQSLDDLVTDGYLKVIPEDPMTHNKDSWVTETSDAMYSLDQTEPGISDVHSGSEETGSNGQAYSTW